MAYVPARFNPFPGLRPFEAEEDHLFFGRDQDVDQLLKRLRSSHFLAVIGGSGSGKSSLVRSGLIPSLYSGYMTRAGSTWRVAIMRPGGDPLGNLADALSENQVLGQSQELPDTNRILIETTLRRSNLGLIDCVRQARLPADDNVLIIIDQFEELFRFNRSSAEQARDKSLAFVKRILAPSRQQDLPLYVLITMRSDYIGECIEYADLPEAINTSQYLIPRMTRAQLRSAITGPVAVGGGQISPRLVVRLLNEVSDKLDQLPVLQHALMRTWDYWITDQTEGEPIDLRHYEAIGTLNEALSRHAEEAYAELDQDRDRAIAEKLFKALTDTSSDARGVRRPASVAELSRILGASTDEVSSVIACFRQAKRSFLTPAEPVRLVAETIVDLSHESLMRIWDRLVAWTKDEKNSAEAYLQLARAATRYEQGKAGLWRDPELELGLQWRAKNRPSSAWAGQFDADFDRSIRFLEISKRERDRQNAERERLRRNKLLVAWGISIVLLLITVYALFQKIEAERAQQLAEHNLQLAKKAVDNMLTEVGKKSLADVPQMEEIRQDLLEKARVFYDLFREQKPTDPELRLEIALAHSRLGEIYRLRGQNAKAETSYVTAVEQLALLHQQFREIPKYQFELANTYNEYGELLRPYDRARAETIYEQALYFQADLVERVPGNPNFQRQLALFYNNRGILLGYEADRAVDAEASYRKAIDSLQILHNETNDPLATFRLAQAMNNLAAQLRQQPEGRKEAESIYLRAVQVMEELLVEQPERREYQEELAKFYNNLGNLLMMQAKLPRALAANQRALQLFEALAAPVRGLRNELANSYNSRGSILAQISRSQLDLNNSYKHQAANAFDRAIEIFETLERDFKDFAKDPDSNARYANTLANQGGLNLQLDNLSEAKRLLSLALEHYSIALDSRAPKSSYRQQVASIYWLLAETHLRSRDHTEAVAAARSMAAAEPRKNNDYRAATLIARAVELARTDQALYDDERRKRVEDYSRAAIRLLRDAFAAGYPRKGLAQDAERSGALYPLREHEDFRKLLAEPDQRMINESGSERKPQDEVE